MRTSPSIVLGADRLAFGELLLVLRANELVKALA
jgi:hypothetical protein